MPDQRRRLDEGRLVDAAQLVPSQHERPAMTDSETPVLDTLAAMTAASLTYCDLDANSLLAARLAALAAVDAPAASYLMHVGPAIDAGVSIEQVQGILVAIAPVIGSARTMSAAARITEALGITVIALEAALEEDEAAE